MILAECLWNCSNGIEATFPLTLLAVKNNKGDIELDDIQKAFNYIRK